MYIKGDLIASGEPFAFALCTELRDKRCDYCFKVLDLKILCQNCSYVSYCSLQCQRDAIKHYNHNHECEILGKRPLSTLTRLIARTISRLEYNGTEESENIGEYTRNWDCLMSHYDDIVGDPSAMYAFDGVLTDLELIFGDKLPDIREVIKIYGKILINSFAVQNEFMEQIGRALYLRASIFDHSCNPTATFIFIGTTIYVKAIKDIPSDDVKDVRISYIDELESTSERQRQLRTQFYFECDCERCKCQNFSPIEMCEDETLRSVCDKLEKLSYDGTSKDSDHFTRLQIQKCVIENQKPQHENHHVEQLVSQLRQKILSLRDVISVRIADFIAIHYKDVDLSLRINEIFRSYYGKYHPRVALRLYKTAVLSDNYPILRKGLLMEAKSITQLITPTKSQLQNHDNYMKNHDNYQRSHNRIIYKYTHSKSLSYEPEPELSSTFHCVIEKELINTHRLLYSKAYNNNMRNKYRTKTRENGKIILT